MKSTKIGKIKKNYYDYVIAFYSLEHLDNLEETVKLIYNILNKKGKLIIAIPNEGALSWGLGRYLFSRKFIIKEFKINYDKVICWEHPNFADKIEILTKRFFNLDDLKSYPSFLPFEDLKFIKYGILKKLPIIKF